MPISRPVTFFNPVGRPALRSAQSRRRPCGFAACAFAVVAFGIFTLAAGPARAFDFFGLFGSDDKPPAVSPNSLPYALTFEARGKDAGDDSDVEQALRDASGTYKLRQDAPADGEGLMRRLRADTGPTLDALWALGYYNATIDVLVQDVPVVLTEDAMETGAQRADTFRNRQAVPVKLVATLGPLFRLRRIHVVYPRADAPDGLPRLAFRLKAGDVARSADLRAAQVRLVDWFRARGHPLAKITDIQATVDHEAAVMDLAMTVDPQPAAGIGVVTIAGTGGVDPAVVASHVYMRRGEPYDPERLAETKKSIGRIQAIGGARIREGDALDADGNLPIFIDVTERPGHVFGGTARYSTKDGPA